MADTLKPVIIKDGFMTISSNAEGIMFSPSQLLKGLFGEKMMGDVYHKRATKPKAKPKAAKPTQPGK